MNDVGSSGGNVELNDADTAANDLTLENVTASALTVTAGGAVKQDAGVTVKVSGLTDVTSGPGKDITLFNAGSELSKVAASGANVKLNDADTAANDLTLESVTASALTVRGGGAVKPDVGVTVKVSGLTDVTSGAGKDITLFNAGNRSEEGRGGGENGKQNAADTASNELTAEDVRASPTTVNAGGGATEDTGAKGEGGGPT